MGKLAGRRAHGYCSLSSSTPSNDEVEGGDRGRILMNLCVAVDVYRKAMALDSLWCDENSCRLHRIGEEVAWVCIAERSIGATAAVLLVQWTYRASSMRQEVSTTFGRL